MTADAAVEMDAGQRSDRSAASESSGPAPEQPGAADKPAAADNEDVATGPAGARAGGGTSPRGEGDAGPADDQGPSPTDFAEPGGPGPATPRTPSGSDGAGGIDDHQLPDDEAPADTGRSDDGSAKYRIDALRATGPLAVGDHGVAIGRYEVFLDGRGRITARRGTLTGLDRLKAAYAWRPWDDDLAEFVNRECVVCITGRSGTGRYTAACLSLSRRYPGSDGESSRVAVIDRGAVADLADLANSPDVLAQETGHILRLAGGERRPSRSSLAVLGDLARLRRATLVLILDADADDPELRGHAIEFVAPDPIEVFQAQLLVLLREGKRCVAQCAPCQQECLTSYVQELVDRTDVCAALRQITRPAEIVDLAGRIASTAPRGDHVLSVLISTRPHQIRRATKILQPEDPVEDSRLLLYKRAFRINYVVFDRRPITYVFEATGWLIEETDRAAGRRPRSRPVLELDVFDLLGDELRPRDERENGRVATALAGASRLVMLPDDSLVEALLDVAWHRIDNSRPALLPWLNRMALDRRRQIRSCAAQIAGQLAEYDYEQIHDVLLRPWASSRSTQTRQVAAWALYTAAARGPLRLSVTQQVRSWARSSSAYLRDCAARAYASGLGQDNVEYALEDLGTIAETPLLYLAPTVSDAVRALYQPERAGTVVRALASWLTNGGTRGQLHALNAFLMLAAPSQVMASPRGSGYVVQVDLLARAAAGAVDLGDLGALWRGALVHQAHSTQAWRTLRLWFLAGDNGVEMATTTASIVEHIATSRPLLRRMGHYVDRVWRKDAPDSVFLREISELIGARDDGSERDGDQ